MAHIHSLRRQVCCIHRVAQLTPCEEPGSLPALLLDQGPLPLQLPLAFAWEGVRRRVAVLSVGEATTTTVGSRLSLTSSRKGVQINPQKIARVTGVLFLITYVTSIPAAFVLYPPLLDDPRYIVGAGADTSVRLGAFLEVILIIANIATAVVLWPILKRVNEILALGFVTARIVESAFIAVGILSLLTVVTLRQAGAAAGADAASLLAAGQSLVALHGWTFLLGPGFMVGVGNGLILGYLMYTSRLVPRGMAVLGLIGGPLIIASGAAIVLGVIEQGGAVQTIAVMPEFLWELALGIWLIVKGFNPSAVASLPTDPDDGVVTGVEQPAVAPSNGHPAPSKA
jgi:Domain of unknown function (DUF4386)